MGCISRLGGGCRAAALVFPPGVFGGLEHCRKGHVGLAEQLELAAGVGIAGVQIRVQLKGATAVGPLDGLKSGALVDLEDLVAFLD